MTDYEDEYPTANYDEIVAEIEALENSHLVGIERNEVNGFVTIRFYGLDDTLRAKMTFDEASDDMPYRAKAVVEYLSAKSGASYPEGIVMTPSVADNLLKNNLAGEADCISVWDAAEPTFDNRMTP